MMTKIKKEKIEEINNNEEEKLKLLNKVEYTNKEIIYKSLYKNKSNCIKMILEFACNSIHKVILLKLPISKGILLDEIISSKNMDKSLYSFKRFLLILSLKSVINIISKSIKSLSEERVSNKNELLNNIIEKDIYFFEIYKTGELIGKINDLENCELNILDDFLVIFIHSISIIYIIYFLIKTSLYLSLVFSILFSLDIISYYITSYFTLPEESANIISEKNDKYRNKVNELITNIKMIKSFAREKSEINSLENYIEKKNFKESLKYYFYLEITNFIRGIEYPVFLLFVGKLILEGKCTLGTFIIFKQYELDFKNSYNLIKFGYNSIINKIQNFKKFLELYDFPVKIRSIKNYIPKEMKGKINFEKVTFAYPLKPTSNILNDLTFSIEPGKTLAICGFSGSGKTKL